MIENNRQRESVRYELINDTDESNSAESTLGAVHRYLRGRYHVVAAAAVACATATAAIAWQMTKPEYESSGLVRVDPVPATTFLDPDALPNPALMTAYVAEQSMILQGRAVLEAAAADPMLRAAGWPTDDEGIAALEGALRVEQNRGQNIISVAVRDLEPNRARAAVDAVLRSYESRAGAPAKRERDLRRTSMDARRAELLARIADLDAELQVASQGAGSELVKRLHVQRVEELVTIESRIDDLVARRDAIDAGLDPAILDGDFLSPVATGSDMSGVDPAVRGLEAQEQDILARIDTLSERYGPRHSMILELEMELETVQLQLVAARDGVAIAGVASPVAAATGGLSVDVRGRINQLLERYESRRTALREEISDLSGRLVAINGVIERSRETRSRLSDVESRLSIIDASDETAATGVTIATWGDLPVVPIRDRRAQLAMAGGLAGSVFGCLLVLGLAAVSPRVRYTDDLAHVPGAPAVAAILPVTDPNDARAELRATRGIHQLRSMIELDTVRPEENVVTITSCARGEGRTSIALALATGLARSGRKTLIIDGDLTCSRLSQELGLHDRPGLVEALGVNPQDARVHETSETGLWALPIGLRGGHREEVLSRPRLQWLMNTLRTRFDAIVIDTGPMLASAEGPTLAAVADRSVLVLERGIRVSSLRAALVRLRRVNAACIGLVLNRALEGDFREIELGSEPATRRGGSIVETRPSTFNPAGESAAANELRAGAARTTVGGWASAPRAVQPPGSTGVDPMYASHPDFGMPNPHGATDPHTAGQGGHGHQDRERTVA